MPMIDADGCLLNVSVDGRDGGPTLMLSNSLGCTLQMWEPQMKALTQVFRVIRYDRRGHGKSGVPPWPYSMERFGRDVLAILDDLNIDKVHWCGLSMGGMVGQWLGANAPERMGKIILSNTACYYPWLAHRRFQGTRTADCGEHEGHAARNARAGLSRLLRGAEHAR
jgi:3-oxoadipate enol-lactonase